MQVKDIQREFSEKVKEIVDQKRNFEERFKELNKALIYSISDLYSNLNHIKTSNENELYCLYFFLEVWTLSSLRDHSIENHLRSKLRSSRDHLENNDFKNKFIIDLINKRIGDIRENGFNFSELNEIEQILKEKSTVKKNS